MIKLSEAIRLGSLLRAQGFGEVFSNLDSDGTALTSETKSCAMGAALEAAGCKVDWAPSTPGASIRGGDNFEGRLVQSITVPTEWLFLLVEFAACPHCTYRHTLRRTIAHLNDVHCLTREAIADFVEVVEQRVVERNSRLMGIVHKESEVAAQ